MEAEPPSWNGPSNRSPSDRTAVHWFRACAIFAEPNLNRPGGRWRRLFLELAVALVDGLHHGYQVVAGALVALGHVLRGIGGVVVEGGEQAAERGEVVV